MTERNEYIEERFNRPSEQIIKRSLDKIDATIPGTREHKIELLKATLQTPVIGIRGMGEVVVDVIKNGIPL